MRRNKKARAWLHNFQESLPACIAGCRIMFGPVRLPRVETDHCIDPDLCQQNPAMIRNLGIRSDLDQLAIHQLQIAKTFNHHLFKEYPMNIKNDQRTILSHSVFVALLLSAFISLTGCKEEGPAEEAGRRTDEAAERTNERLEEMTEQRQEAIEEREESMGSESGSVEQYLDDSAITAKVKAEMVADPILSATKIDVITEKGVVKLSGVVDSQQSVDRALEITRGIKGVQSVENNLVVTPVPR